MVPLERNVYGHPYCWVVVGKAVREGLDCKSMGESTVLGMLICAQTSGAISVRARGRHQDGREEAKSETHVVKD